MKKRPGVVVCCPPNAAGHLSVVEVGAGYCVMSTGEWLLVNYEKLRSLVEQLCQDSCPVTVRTWWTPGGNELVEIHRMDKSPELTTAMAGDAEEVL